MWKGVPKQLTPVVKTTIGLNHASLSTLSKLPRADAPVSLRFPTFALPSEPKIFAKLSHNNQPLDGAKLAELLSEETMKPSRRLDGIRRTAGDKALLDLLNTPIEFPVAKPTPEENSQIAESEVTEEVVAQRAPSPTISANPVVPESKPTVVPTEDDVFLAAMRDSVEWSVATSKKSKSKSKKSTKDSISAKTTSSVVPTTVQVSPAESVCSPFPEEISASSQVQTLADIEMACGLSPASIDVPSFTTTATTTSTPSALSFLFQAAAASSSSHEQQQFLSGSFESPSSASAFNRKLASDFLTQRWIECSSEQVEEIRTSSASSSPSSDFYPDFYPMLAEAFSEHFSSSSNRASL